MDERAGAGRGERGIQRLGGASPFGRPLSPYDAYQAAWAACAARVRAETLAEVEAVAQQWVDEAYRIWVVSPRDRGTDASCELKTLEANSVVKAVQAVRAAEEAAHGG